MVVTQSTWEYNFCISRLRTTINMKIILALLGFFVTVSWGFPAPEPGFPFCSTTAQQNCEGSQCGQNNGAGASGQQNCQGSQCNQNNGGGDFSGFPQTKFGTFNQFTQNCGGSQCGQNNGRKKRASVQVRSAKPPFRF